VSRVYKALRKAEEERIAGAIRGDSFIMVGESHAPPRPPHIKFPTRPAEYIPPRVDGRAPLLVAGDREYPVAAEEFHLLAIGLQSWAREHSKYSFMITSALSGEGKSFVALNLATCLARLGNRVLLVDADLRGSTLDYCFNLAPLRGLIAYLNEEIGLDGCVHTTPIPGLMMVAAGGSLQAPTEVLARGRMQQFFRDAKALTPPHYIIVDAPAAWGLPEPRILGRLIDSLLLVVAANRTPRELVKRTIEKVRGTPIFGVVMNQFEPPLSAVVNYPDKYLRSATTKPRDEPR
jgi:protein-tyrosine kinase